MSSDREAPASGAAGAGDGDKPTEIPAEQLYQQRLARYADEAERYGRYAGKLTLVRGLTFLDAAGCFVMALLDVSARPFWTAAGTLVLVAFLSAAIIDDWLTRQHDRCQELKRVNQWQLARKQRRWNACPTVSIDVPREHAAVARDLDLFGHASLFQLICLARTPRGKSLLRDWLLEPSTPEEVGQRQRAVSELTAEFALREELLLRGQLLAAGLAGPEKFISWVESTPLLQRRPWLKWISRMLPVTAAVALLALGIGWLSANAAAAWLILVLIMNVSVSVVFTGRVHDIFDNISTRDGELRHYLALFELAGQLPHQSPRLREIHQTVAREDGGTLRRLRGLHRIMRLAALRHDPLLSILYFVLQATTLWDFHVLWMLERWQQRCRPLVPDWFEALGEVEALMSLASLAFEQPDWCFAEIRPDGPAVVTAEGLGHPLLPDEVRVVNDVEVGPAGTVLLVTGSNMSGKSTLLRAIGLNCLLAEAGGPACARSLWLPPLVVTTSMRVQDSLEDGVSFFMAELQRLKRIVDQASLSQERSERVLLYLLDEVLQGTNSVERHMAVARVLAHLVAKRAIGAVSTHDLELARSPELSQCCQAVHFRETLHGAESDQQMTFDYRLRPGVATTTNAMKLLEMVGLVPQQD